MKDDDHTRKLLDEEEYALYRKASDEAGRPLPETYRKNGRKHWRYDEQTLRQLQKTPAG